MIAYSTGFVKSVLSRDEMLQVNQNRIPYPADLHLTSCKNPKLLRLPSSDAGHPAAAGYPERRILVGCGGCEDCERDNQIRRVLTWSQRVKAFVWHETHELKSYVNFYTITFPRHLELGDAGNEHAPSADMVQDAWSHFRRLLANYYRRQGVKASDAVNQIGFIEEGEERGRLHMHVIAAFRRGYKHPYESSFRELLGFSDRFGEPYPMVLDGLGKIWRGVLRSRGYEKLQNWYREPVKSPGQIAGYVTSKYLVKGFFSERVFRVRAGHQKFQWGDRKSGWESLTAWYRDRRYGLDQQRYRRWVGFRIVVNEVNEGNMSAHAKRIAARYADAYENHVTIEGRRVKNIDRNSLTWQLLQGFPEVKEEKIPAVDGIASAMHKASGRRRLFNEPSGLAISIQLKPVMIALSDRPVSHPAGADYLSVAFYADDGSFGPIERLNRPRVLIKESDRFNLCGASHWWPMDGNLLRFRETEAFQEVVAWNESTVQRFNDIIRRLLSRALPGTPWAFFQAGMELPVDIVDRERVDRIAAGFPEVFPDTDLKVEPLPDREVARYKIGMEQLVEEVQESLQLTSGWNEVSNRRARDTTIAGIWPDFFLKKGQVEIIDRLHTVRTQESTTNADGCYMLPTGWGKSLCFQQVNLPGGITWVISPLTALIRDQYERLHRNGVNVTWIGAEHSLDVKIARLKSVGALGQYSPDTPVCIVYSSPEALDPHYKTPDGEERKIPQFFREGHIAVSHLVVDEAHCITEWGGQDQTGFRPSYRRLPDIIDTWQFKPKALSLFSATISPRILMELRRTFGGDIPLFALPVERRNLFLQRYDGGFYDFYAAHPGIFKELPMVVYCGTRIRCEELSAFLCQQGHNADFYHAGLSDTVSVQAREDGILQWDREPVRDKSGEVMLLTRDTKFGKKGTPRTRKVPVMTTEPAYPDRDREDIEKRFRNGDIDILCCTIAFGMGVDIAGIRTVIHDSFPASLEDYVQQSGRVGRDGELAECVLLNNPGMTASPPR